MNSNNDLEAFFNQKGDPETERFVEKNLQITEQIFAILRQRGWSQKGLARALGKSEAEISKWLSGMHNLTLKSLAKIEFVLDEDIIITPQAARLQFDQVRFVKVNVYASVNTPVHSGDYIDVDQPRLVKLKVIRA